MMRRPFAAGNWKMNTNATSAEQLAGGLAQRVGQLDSVDIAVFPPFPYLQRVQSALRGSKILLGAQDCYPEAKGAFTGEVSPAMLLDCGCQWVLVGHSERRHVLGETDPLLARKLTFALAASLRVILCVGEKLEQRKSNQTEAVVEAQLQGGLGTLNADQMKDIVIAYEPVWAIGTGVNATPDQAEDVHRFIRGWLGRKFGEPIAQATRIQYGGSVTAANAATLLSQPNVDGVLVGGASLLVDDFTTIVTAADNRK
jgi:triosephosphate isomerase